MAVDVMWKNLEDANHDDEDDENENPLLVWAQVLEVQVLLEPRLLLSRREG